MIDLETETLLSFAEASRHFPGHPHLSQIYRYAMRGLRGVRLEWVRCGGKRFTSKEAITRFCYALTRADGGDVPPVAPTRKRKRAMEQAEKELAEAGFEVGG